MVLKANNNPITCTISEILSCKQCEEVVSKNNGLYTKKKWKNCNYKMQFYVINLQINVRFPLKKT